MTSTRMTSRSAQEISQLPEPGRDARSGPAASGGNELSSSSARFDASLVEISNRADSHFCADAAPDESLGTRRWRRILRFRAFASHRAYAGLPPGLAARQHQFSNESGGLAGTDQSRPIHIYGSIKQSFFNRPRDSLDAFFNRCARRRVGG